MKITSVLLMPEIEASVAFWTERFGYRTTVTAPHGDQLGFAILQNGESELMLQSHASAVSDIEALDKFNRDSKAALFIEVKDFGDVTTRLSGYPVALPVRDTFYGMREVGVFEPGGNFVIFACRVK